MKKKAASADHHPAQNGLLGSLPADEFARLEPDLELVPLPLGLTLAQSGDHINYLHFPVSGIVSLIYELEDGSSNQTVLVGKEGVVGISIFMGGDSLPSRTRVQNVGHAYRLKRGIMKREFDSGGALQHLALRYTQALICQTSQTAVCNRHHSLDQQLSRWLLMSSDRLEQDELLITQEQLGALLGVRRESVTLTAGKLQQDALIRCSRGRMAILDRAGLVARTCECYAKVKDEYANLLPEPRKTPFTSTHA